MIVKNKLHYWNINLYLQENYRWNNLTGIIEEHLKNSKLWPLSFGPLNYPNMKPSLVSFHY